MWNTSVDPSLPECAFTAMPSFSVNARSRAADAQAAALRAAQRRRSRAMAAAALVPMALLALAGAGWRAVHRRRLREQPELKRRSLAREGAPLLPMEGCSSREAGQRPEGAQLPFDFRCRRQRIESLLSGSRRRIEMTPMEQLPAALTHQIRSMRHGGWHAAGAAAAGAPCGGAASAAAPAVAAAAVELAPYSPLQLHRHSSWGGFGSSSSSGSRSSDCSGSSDGSRDGATPRGSRRWGLETHSLQLLPGELELYTAPDGTLALLGEGSSAAVYLGNLGGLDVAVKVGGVCTAAEEKDKHARACAKQSAASEAAAER